MWNAVASSNTSQRIIGCDPGASGALAIIDPSCWSIAIADTPNRIVKVNRKERKIVDVVRFAHYLRSLDARLIVSEELHARPFQNAQGTFSLGRYFGQIEMGAAMLDLPHVTPRPEEWKRRMMVSADKDYSRQRASQLIPCIAHMLDKKKNHDRAEAALLALFGCFYLGIVPERLTFKDTP